MTIINDRVSIVIPTFNRKDDVGVCITSILKQDFPDLEILVIDDASTDGTVMHISQKFPFVRMVKNEMNKGVNYCRNLGVVQSTGRFVLFLDSDMELVNPGQISKMVALMRFNSGAGALGGIYDKSDDKVWGCYFDGTRKFFEGSQGLTECDYVPSGNLFMRKEDVYFHSGFDEFIKGDGTESEMGMLLKRRGLKNLFGPGIAAKHRMSQAERNNIGLGLDRHVKEQYKCQQRNLFGMRNRLRFFLKNGLLVDAVQFAGRKTVQNSISFLAFIKQQFLGLKGLHCEKYADASQKMEALIFKIIVIVDPFVWNIIHFEETMKSRGINFLAGKQNEEV